MAAKMFKVKLVKSPIGARLNTSQPSRVRPEAHGASPRARRHAVDARHGERPFATSSLQLPDQGFIDMQLNTIKPAEGSKNRRRVGRGIGSGLGKTGGRGMNGQSRVRATPRRSGFEGGQMPLQRRLPKRGFTSLMRDFRAEITVGTLAKLVLPK